MNRIFIQNSIKEPGKYHKLKPTNDLTKMHSRLKLILKITTKPTFKTLLFSYQPNLIKNAS